MKLLSSGTLIVLGYLFVKPIVQSEVKDTFLKKEFDEIEQYIIHRDSLNESVSKVSVAWHLDHMLLTIYKIYGVMDTSKVENYKSRFNVTRAMMFTFKKIPRGRAQSPSQVKPMEIIETDSIYAHLKKAKLAAMRFDALPEKAHFKHPVIGVLNRKRAKKFLKIHTRHHLKIIKDILNE